MIKEGPGIGAHRGADPRGCMIMDFLDQAQMSNRGAVESQISKPMGQSSFGTNTSGPVTLTKDFAATQDVTITAQWGTAGTGSNSIVLESVLVELLRG